MTIIPVAKTHALANVCQLVLGNAAGMTGVEVFVLIIVLKQDNYVKKALVSALEVAHQTAVARCAALMDVAVNVHQDALVVKPVIQPVNVLPIVPLIVQVKIVEMTGVAAPAAHVNQAICVPIFNVCRIVPLIVQVKNVEVMGVEGVAGHALATRLVPAGHV